MSSSLYSHQITHFLVDLLFTHLNQIVLYFGLKGDESGLAEMWASGVLQGVMMSKPHLTQAPLNHLTTMRSLNGIRLRLGGLRSVTKKERRKIKVLRPTSNQEAIEADVAKVKFINTIPLIDYLLIG